MIKLFTFESALFILYTIHRENDVKFKDDNFNTRNITQNFIKIISTRIYCPKYKINICI